FFFFQAEDGIRDAAYGPGGGLVGSRDERAGAPVFPDRRVAALDRCVRDREPGCEALASLALRKKRRADLHIPMNLHRVEVEHELRLLLLRLRQHLVHVGRNELELLAVLKRSISSAVTLLRHTLLAFGEEPPQGAANIFARIEELTGAKAEAFSRIYSHRETGAIEGDSLAAYDAYMHALEKVIVALDGMVPKREWQRAGH